MGLFTELLLTPALPQDKLDLAKAQVDQLSLSLHQWEHMHKGLAIFTLGQLHSEERALLCLMSASRLVCIMGGVTNGNASTSVALEQLVRYAAPPSWLAIALYRSSA